MPITLVPFLHRLTPKHHFQHRLTPKHHFQHSTLSVPTCRDEHQHAHHLGVGAQPRQQPALRRVAHPHAAQRVGHQLVIALLVLLLLPLLCLLRMLCCLLARLALQGGTGAHARLDLLWRRERRRRRARGRAQGRRGRPPCQQAHMRLCHDLQPRGDDLRRRRTGIRTCVKI
jgi:hypothetical protein